MFEYESQIIKGKVDTDDSFSEWIKNSRNNSAKAANQALNSKIQIQPHDPSNKFTLKNPKKSISQKKDTVNLGGKSYSYVVVKSFDESDADPWCTWDIDHKTKIITVYISMVHDFIQTFFSMKNAQQNLGIEYLATYLVISEIRAQKDGGLGKKASMIRDNLNQILYELPPRERKRTN